jgi:hypothetical protein
MKRSIAITSLFSAFSADVYAQSTLCNEGEKIVFACTADDGKAIAVCASPDLSGITGYLQFRYGARDNLELALPPTTTAPRDYFQQGVRVGGGAGVNYIRFTEGERTYAVYGAWNRAWHQNGVVVEENGLSVQQLMCKGTLPMSGNSMLYETAQLPREPNPTFVAP